MDLLFANPVKVSSAPSLPVKNIGISLIVNLVGNANSRNKPRSLPCAKYADVARIEETPRVTRQSIHSISSKMLTKIINRRLPAAIRAYLLGAKLDKLHKQVQSLPLVSPLPQSFLHVIPTVPNTPPSCSTAPKGNIRAKTCAWHF